MGLRMVGEGGNPLGAGLQDLYGAGVCVAALALVHDRAHAIARDGARNEHDIAAVTQSRDALSPEGERVDLELQLIAPLRAGRALVRRRVGQGRRVGRHRDEYSGAIRSSSRAFCAWRRFSAWSQMR